MTSDGCTLSNIELNNQLLMNKKLSKSKTRTRNEPPLLHDANKEPNDMSHLMGIAVGMETNFGQVENKINSEEPKLSKEDPQETRHLKELLLLHLDWIQQQQESLLAKDKLILRLKQEKEALKCRLERMDRRMSLLRHKNETSPSQSGDTPSRKDGSPGARASIPVAGRAENRGFKRKHSLEPENLGRRFSDVVKSPRNNMVNKSTSMEDQTADNIAFTPTKSRTSRLSRTQRLRDSPAKHQAYLYSQQPPRKCRSHTQSMSEDKTEKGESESDSEEEEEEEDEREMLSPKSVKEEVHVDSESDDEVQFVDQSARKRLMSRIGHHTATRENVMRTNNMYYVPGEVQLPPWEISPKKSKPDNVVVPTWKIKHIPTGYQLEGTENLTDEIYNKRHMKPEADEKRRKRWDAQMMREQKMLERLQQRGGATVGPSTSTTAQTPKNKPQREPLVSFLPDPANVKFLEICDQVPVTAFGYPVPDIAAKEFSLEWYSLDRRPSEDHFQQRTPRGRRKHCY